MLGQVIQRHADAACNALVGVLIVNVIDNGMVVIGLPDFIQDGMLGLLVILAVVLSTDRKMLSFVK